MKFKKNDLFGFCHRVAYAALVSAIVWIFVFLPLPEGISYPGDMIIQVVRWLDLPIAAATQIMPCNEFAVDMWFRVRCPELGYGIVDLRGYFFNHMRIGIPTYVLLFYLPNLYRVGRGWWRQRRGSGSHRASLGPNNTKELR